MAILIDVDRKHILIKYMSDISVRRETTGLLKADLIAAINSIDAWIDSNVVAFNSAISQPARLTLTAKQKAELLMLIVSKRWEVA